MQTAHVVVDLGYGDAGKGSIVDALTRKTGAKLIVRHNGGGQAAHNVVLPDGTHHTFAQFGSGSFVPGVKTYLSRHFLWNPITMEAEAKVLVSKGLADIRQRVFVDARALVVTPWHRAMNRLREFAREGGRHGSCGEGIGEAVSDRDELSYIVLHAADLERISEANLTAALEAHARHKREQWLALDVDPVSWDRLGGDRSVGDDLKFLMDEEAPGNCARLFKSLASRAQLVARDGDTEVVQELFGEKTGTEVTDVIFEGAQGVLIDETYGFAPYHTWSDCTSANAVEILAEVGWFGDTSVVGVLRAYAIRHGAGPFVTECRSMTGNSALRELHNDVNPWQGKPRLGHFDVVAAHYALKADGHVDSLAITCIDRLRMNSVGSKTLLSEREFGWKICTGYKWPGGVGPLVFEPGWSRSRDAAKLLAEARPEYGIAGVGSAELLHQIHNLLDLSISIESRGPTYLDKTFNGG